MRLAIFGAGGMGRELADIARRSTDWPIVFVVDEPEGADVQGIPVIAPDALEPDDRLVLALGTSTGRKAVADRFAGRGFGSVVASSATRRGIASWADCPALRTLVNVPATYTRLPIWRMRCTVPSSACGVQSTGFVPTTVVCAALTASAGDPGSAAPATASAAATATAAPRLRPGG